MEGPFMESMWQNLPSDALEKVVTFLPIASLCRFRTVSKKWNNFIAHPDFALIHARASPPEDYVLIAVRFEWKREWKPELDTRWEVLDVANKKFYTLSDAFLTEFAKKNKLADFSGLYEVERALLAADGGLLCFCYSMYCRGSPNSPSYPTWVVCNPVLKTAKQLPTFEWGESYQRVVMSTDRLTMEYEIFVIHNGCDIYGRWREFYTYESKTGRWRKAPYDAVPQLHTEFFQRRWCPVSTFIKNKFYKLYIHRDRHKTEVLAYDKVTGVGSELGIQVLTGGDERQLVVSNDRLFCVSEDSRAPSLKIFEIVLASNECTQVAEMPTELLYWLLQTNEEYYAKTYVYLDAYDSDHSSDSRERIVVDTDSDDAREDFEAKEPIIATGCANAILICSWAGRSVVYSLSTRSWYRYPDNNVSKGKRGFSNDTQQLYGGRFCLSLCAP